MPLPAHLGALLGQQRFSQTMAQQVVDEIKVLPERNPDLPVFKCTPQTAKPSEAIVLRFDTAAGIREIWVEYDGCESAGFFTGTHTYGLYSAPLKLFMRRRPPDRWHVPERLQGLVAHSPRLLECHVLQRRPGLAPGRLSSPGDESESRAMCTAMKVARPVARPPRG